MAKVLICILTLCILSLLSFQASATKYYPMQAFTGNFPGGSYSIGTQSVGTNLRI